MKVRIVIAGVALAAFILFTYHSYRQDLAAARARISIGSHIVDTPCGPIEYAVAGSGSVVLVIHGAGGGFDQGLEMARSLVEGGFRVVAMSRFGYLRTPLPADASPIAQAGAHVCLLDALGVPKAAVLGGSAGASSAMQLCLQYPERCSAMILGVPITFAPRPASEPHAEVSAVAQFVTKVILQSDFAFWAASKLARDAVMKTILATPPTDVENATVQEQERVGKVMRNILPVSERAAGLLNDMAVCTTLPRYDLEKFTIPTLVVSVENDLFGTFINARYTAEHIPGARFVGYRTGGHLWVGHQEELWSEATKFLSAAIR